MTRTAVILFNLGGPDAPKAIKPFLQNLFSDPAILRVPAPFRHILGRLIVRRRVKIAQGIYAKIGGRSPILENTQAQGRALEQALAGLGEVKCFVSMRYWYPFAKGAVQAVKQFAPDKIVLLPLYPQFSTTTTASSFKSWRRAARKAGLTAPTKKICCYPEEAGFIRALADATRSAYEKAAAYGKARILFSAHGLPEKIVKSGDPYPAQCARTAEAIVHALGIRGLDWVLCYQSRVGPLKWIDPSTDDEICRAGAEKIPVVVVPISFVSEHSETLVELDIEYRHAAERTGVPFYIRVPAVGTAPAFIEGLAKLVREAAQTDRDCLSAAGGRICAGTFSGCPSR